jgi:biofilm PGA synthesis lipoprotein PgaB
MRWFVARSHRSLRVAIVAFAFAIAPATFARGATADPANTLPRLAANIAIPYVAVLVWHDVLPSKDVYFDTTTAEFAAQLDAIAKGGFHVVTLAMLRDRLVRGTPLPAKPLVLTFDDNARGIGAYAFPLLQQHRFPATLFVHTNYVGKKTSKAHNSWDELRAMERSGLIDVQSLTANHPPDLTKLSDADVAHEFELSKRSLEYRLGRKVFALVYPYDVYDARVERLAAQAGYTLGFTEDHGNAAASSSLLEIHRYSITVPERFAQALAAVRAGGGK